MLIKGAANASGHFSSGWEQLFLGELAYQSHFPFVSLACILLAWNWGWFRFRVLVLHTPSV